MSTRKVCIKVTEKTIEQSVKLLEREDEDYRPASLYCPVALAAHRHKGLGGARAYSEELIVPREGHRWDDYITHMNRLSTAPFPAQSPYMDC